MNESEMSIHWTVPMFSIYEDIITMYKWDVYYLLHGATHMWFTLGIVLQMPTGPAYQLTAGMKLIYDLGPMYLNGLRSIRTLTELYAAHLPTFSFGGFGLVEASYPRGHDFFGPRRLHISFEYRLLFHIPHQILFLSVWQQWEPFQTTNQNQAFDL